MSPYVSSLNLDSNRTQSFLTLPRWKRAVDGRIAPYTIHPSWRSCSCVPSSEIRPSSSTTIQSACCTAVKRCVVINRRLTRALASDAFENFRLRLRVDRGQSIVEHKNFRIGDDALAMLTVASDRRRGRRPSLRRASPSLPAGTRRLCGRKPAPARD